jgi:hypothetical protein
LNPLGFYVWEPPWPKSASELYRLSESAKLVPTFADRGVPRGQREGSLRPCSRFSRPEPLLFLSSSSSKLLTRLSGHRSEKSGSTGNRIRISGGHL